jgi:hypothetical protein
MELRCVGMSGTGRSWGEILVLVGSSLLPRHRSPIVLALVVVVVLGPGHAIVERLACSAHLKTRETADDENDDDDEDDWRGTTRFATGY